MMIKNILKSLTKELKQKHIKNKHHQIIFN